MKGRRVRTGRLDGNQSWIDEFEYFLEGIGGFLFGPPGEDFRFLAIQIGRTRNLSALVSLAKAGDPRNPAEDLRFLYGELEARASRALGRDTPDFREEGAFFRYRTYLDLLERPERILDRVPLERRLEVANRLSRGVFTVAPRIARLNALAWLGVVGVHDLEAELNSTTPAVLSLESDVERTAAAVEAMLAASDAQVGPGLHAFYRVAHDVLAEDYRGQLARLAATAAKTQPLR